jgi:hypothetical protein
MVKSDIVVRVASTIVGVLMASTFVFLISTNGVRTRTKGASIGEDRC